MAVGFQTWTVLPHKPIVELSSNLWWVEGKMSESNKRVMVLVRLADGRIVVHNAIALDQASMAKIDAWGEVAAIVVPNRFHRQDAFIMQTRYPKAKVYAPRGAISAAAKATDIAGSYADIPRDASLTAREIAGIGDREGVLVVRSEHGASAIFCDTVLNLPKIGGIMGAILHPTGTLAVPRPTTLLFTKDRSALKRDLLGIAAGGLTRIIPGHGAVVADDAAARLKEAADRIRA